MIIAHNLQAANANRQLGIVNKQAAGSTEKLTSGYRVNRAADDAAGLSISEKMRKQIRGLSRASENAQDGISLVQTAEGALNEVHDMLQRMNELAIQSANGTNSETDRGYIQDEVDQLKYEINRISTTVKFNELYLLDGSLGDPRKAGEVEKAYKDYMDEVDRKLFATELTGAFKGKRVSLDDINERDGLKIIYKEITHDVNTIQAGSGSSQLNGSDYDALKNVLKTEIVPQAVKALLTTYPDTFGYLANSSIGIGLDVYKDSKPVLASVTLGANVWPDGTATPQAELTYKLSVNINTLLDKNGKIDLTQNNIREDLEVTIIHEMMHAMMDEVHTNGMLGFNGSNFVNSEQFPGWFAEGMAQSVAGGCYNGNDWVNGGGSGWTNGQGGLEITDTTSEAVIAARLTGSGSKLGAQTATSEYGTGYLACMYLGYLANGGGSVTQDGIRKGLDKILGELRGNSTTKGKGLNDVIKDNTNGKYSGLGDFENKFGDSESAAFVKELVRIVGTNGTGGLAADFSFESGILPDTAPSPKIGLFELDLNHSDVTNQYPKDYPVMSGGGAHTTGTGIDGNATGGTGTPGTGGGGTGGGGTGGIGGGTGGTGGTPTGPIWKEVTHFGGLKLQVNAESDERMTIHIEGMSCRQIGIQDVDVTTQDNATRAIDMIAFALNRVSSQRSALGAYQNRLEHTIKNLDNVVENTQAAESKIRDTDMADEMVKHSNNQILQQAGQSVLAQTAQAANGVMRLLQ